ncbi:MAG: hypothetical protein H7256_01720 [Bdellovibrio sp.]|nr:hypothetical protein [Bdellovibrio sp.]
MSAFVLILSLIITVLSTNTVFAETILVPDSSVSFEDYSAKCRIEGYTCTQKFFYDEQLQKPTPQFDALIDSIDLSDKNFVLTLPKNVQNILQKEMVSIEQLEMMMRLLEQTHDQSKDLKAVKQLMDELKYVQSSLPTDKNFNLNQEKFVIFFKKVFTAEAFKQVKKSYLNLPYTDVSFNSIPVFSATKGKSFAARENLVTGVCENAAINGNVNLSQWKVMSEKSCGWSEGFNKSTSGITSTIKENKGWFITGAVLIGAAILASQYEVKFQF